jgi:hypothetical protein
MSGSKRLVALLFFVLASWTTRLSTSNAQVYDPQALKFTISLDKKVYLVNEAVGLTLVLENASNSQIYAPILNPLHDQLVIHVVSSDGDTLPSSRMTGNTMGPRLDTLDSLENDIYFLNLLGPIYEVGLYTEEAVFTRVIPPGRYSVQAQLRYSNQEETTTIPSNTIQLEVRRTSGGAKEIQDIVLEAWRRKCIKQNDCRSAAEDLLRIMNQDPASPYIDAVYQYLAYLLRHELPEGLQGETYNSIGNRYIDQYPDGILVLSFIDGLRPGPGKTSERKKFYQDIFERHPNTKAAMYAQKRLDRWRKGKIWADEPMPED